MDERKRNQQGSPSRDKFKRKHKELGGHLYSCDLDLVFANKYPFPDIAAATDYKGPGDDVTFTETIVYNSLVLRGIPVFLIEGDREADGPFDVKEYLGGHHGTPTIHTNLIQTGLDWKELEHWENVFRKQRASRFSK